MPDFLVEVVVGVSLMAVFLGGTHVIARRRRAALGRGDEAVFRVRLAGDQPPYPSRPRRGKLRVRQEGLVWTASAGNLALDLTGTGIRPIGQREPRMREGASDGDIVMTAADGMGVRLRLIGNSTTVEQLKDVLRERGVPEQPLPVSCDKAASRRLSGLYVVAAALLVLALLGGAFTVWARMSGVQVTATVVSEPDSDDYCTVRWVDPRDGRTKENGADCYWEVGEKVEFVALGDPLRGEVVELEDTWAWAVISAVVGLSALGAVGVHHWRRRRDARLPAPPSALSKAPSPAPELTVDQLNYDQISAALRLRARVEGWPFDVVQPTATRSSRRASKQLAWATVGAAFPLAIGLVFGLLAGWSSFAGVWASTGPTAEVVATVDGDPTETLPFAPDDLEITFPLRDGGTSNTLVAVAGLPKPRPKTLRVAYDLDDSDRVRALEYDGALRGSAIGGALILGGFAFTAWRWFSLVAVGRATRRARASPRTSSDRCPARATPRSVAPSRPARSSCP